MKKIYKLAIGVLVIFLIIFGAYLYDLHALAVEGNNIFEQRCTTVNPPLIAYKKAFLNFADASKNPGKYTDKQAAEFFKSYLDGMNVYAPKEAFWLLEQGDFVNRWDFKLISPWYVKEAAGYQIKMYEGYRDEAQAFIDVADGKITEQAFQAKFKDARGRRDKYNNLYNEIFDKVQPMNDWRKFFQRVPVPALCNDDNLTIPDTSGALDEDPAPVENPETTG